jgi:hypothetical protein
MKQKLAISFLISALLGLLFMLYSLNRNSKVFNFRNEVIQICYDYNRSDIPDKKIVNAFLIYHNMPSYTDMIYSFKPLKLETYLDKKVVDELNRPYKENLKDIK